MAIQTPAADAPYKQWRDYAAAVNPGLTGSRLTEKTREYIQFARSAQGGIDDVTGPVISKPPGDPRPGYYWVQNADGSWVEVAADAGGPGDPANQVNPTDPPTDPTDPPAENPNEGTRRIARDYLRELFGTFGFSADDVNQLMGELEPWITQGYADGDGEALMMKFRATTTYQKRFAGMAELKGRGQAISEAEYIQLESSYRNVMQNYGLPPTFYDNPADYARLIGAGLSVREVEERVVAAKQSLNPLVAQELEQYYGVSQGTQMAYLLGLTDEKGVALESARTQQQIRQEGRAAQIGAAAERAGFNMDKIFAERLGGTSLGQNIDPFQMGTLANLEGTFDQARRVADRETTLAAIDKETYDQRDALSAAFGDEQKKLASERRARRERARFSGTSGAAASSLGVERNL